MNGSHGIRAGFAFLTLLLASATSLAGPAHPNLPPLSPAGGDSTLHALARLQLEWGPHAANWIEGFATPVSGERITYNSPLPEVTEALLSRATDGAMAIEWETAPVPSAGLPDSVTFVWMMGLMAQEPHRRFDFFLNGEEWGSFRTGTRRAWAVEGSGGGTLRFRAVLADQHGDLHGFMRLTVPSSLLRLGRSQILKIVGEDAGSMSWAMTFLERNVASRLTRHHESAFWYRLATAADRRSAQFTAAAAWAGGLVTLSGPDGTAWSASLRRAGGSSTVNLRAGDGSAGLLDVPVVVRIDGREVDRIDTWYTDFEQASLRPDGLVVLRQFSSDGSGSAMEVSGSAVLDLKDGVDRVAASLFREGTMDIVTSSHQDIAWMDAPAACVVWRDTSVVTPALDLLERDPSYHYSIEQSIMLKEYLERRPERLEQIRRFTQEGRLEWGATYNQPYEGMYSGESLVRGLYYGRRWLRETLGGYDARTAWNVDVPGRTLQMAQILKKSGVDYLVMSRFRPGFFWWESPDGSRIGAYSPGHYHGASDFMRRVSAPEVLAGIPAAFASWEDVYRSTGLPPTVPVVVSSDMSEPRDYAREMRAWNDLSTPSPALPAGAAPPVLPRLRYNTMQSVMDELFSGDADLPVIRGERPNVWLYIHGPTHHQAITASREAAHALTSAEIFSSWASSPAGGSSAYPMEALRRAWEAQMYPDHGWGGKNGHITDSVFQASYQSALAMGTALRGRALRGLADGVDRRSDLGEPVVVFNPLLWERSGIASFMLGGADDRSASYEVVDEAGRVAPAVVSVAPGEGKGRSKGVLVDVAVEDVPPVGYRTYYVRPVDVSPAPTAGDASESDRFTFENDFYRIDFVPGGVDQVTDKALGEALFRTDKFLAGELFTMQSVGNGAGEFAAVQQPTMEGFDRMTRYDASWRRTGETPLWVDFELAQAMPHVRVEQRVRIYKVEKRIDFDVALLDWDGTESREFRLAFPLAFGKAEVTYEVPFGALTVGRDEMPGAAGERYVQPVVEVRPREVLDWISASGERAGVTLRSSVAVMDFSDPTDNPVGYTILQPVLLASRRSCHWEGNWYLQEGDHRFSFSLTSHEPGWKNGYRFAEGVAAPLMAVAGAPVGMGAAGSELDADVAGSVPETGKAGAAPAGAVSGSDKTAARDGMAAGGAGANPSEKAATGLADGLALDPGTASFLTVDREGLVLSTIKRAEDDERATVVRLVEMEGTGGPVGLRFPFVPARAARVNLIEENPEPLEIRDGAVVVEVGPFAVETVMVWE